MTELFDIYSQYKRSRKEPPEITAMINAEGGEVLEYRHISRLVKSPFQGLRAYGIIYEFRVQYGNRRGFWYVRTSRDKDLTDWVWLDIDGDETLPVEKKFACVISDVHAVGWWADMVFILSIILTALLVATVIYLVYF